MKSRIFNNEVIKALSIAEIFVKEFQNPSVSPPHILKAIINRQFSLRKRLEQIGKDVYYIENWVDFRLQKLPKTSKVIFKPDLDSASEAILEEAQNIMIETSRESIDLDCIIAAICIPGVGFTFEQLKTFPISHQEVIDKLIKVKESKGINKTKTTKILHNKGDSALSTFCINKTQLGLENKLDNIVGRDKEIRLISETLSRRSKPNAIIAGEPGVGKTAIIDGLVNAINNKKVPNNLINAVIFELDLGALIAGASYKGEIEDRLKKIIKEIKEYDKAILFIDEIHLLLDKHGGTAGAANLLKPELAKGELTIIGATTQAEFAKYIEGDEAFARRFELIRINEPSVKETLLMLKAVLSYYTEHHNIKVENEALKEVILLSKRFNKDRSLPDAAIDLLDRSMAAIKMMIETSEKDIKQLQSDFLELTEKVKSESTQISLELLKDFYYSIANRLSYILLQKINYNDEIRTERSVEGCLDIIKKVIENLEAKNKELSPVLGSDDIRAVISFKTGIPVGKLRSSEQERLLNIENELKKRVIGQQYAISEIAQAIRRSRAGIRKVTKPIGSFFLVGPTGTGKTELAKTLADYLFQDESAMIRFDMSEFTEEASVSLLHGASPGYVGYEEGGLLVNEIRQKPYSVVLFDEIEKAYTGIYKIFFQILDEGKLHDKLGKEGDFTNSIILFTSNIGSEQIINSFRKNNKLPSEKELKELMKNYFPPAFINRLDKIIPFSPIHSEVISKIFDIHFNKVRKILDDKNIKISVSEKAKAKLSELGYNIEYGARPLLGVIRDYIETPLANMIISGELKESQTVKVELSAENQFVWEIQ